MTSLDTQSSPGHGNHFCNLPLEIREGIYRPLLRLSFWQERKPFSRHDLSLAILRVNRKIHDEAERILYEENSWIRIKMDYRAHRTMEEALNMMMWTLKRRPSDIRLYPTDNFPGIPAMDITIMHLEANEDQDLWTYLISPYNLTHVARCMVPAVPGYDISKTMLKLHIAGTIGRGQWPLEQLLDPWRQARGLGKVVVTGSDNPNASELGRITTAHTDTATCKEVQDRIEQYFESGCRLYKAGNFYQAFKFFHEGAAYTHWILTYPYSGLIHDVFGWYDLKEFAIRVCTDSMIGCVKSRLDVGDTEDARLYLHRLCSEFAYYLEEIDIAKCHMLYGESHILDGALNAAAYSFLRALTDFSPTGVDDAGVAGANQAVDQLLKRVRSSPDPKHQIVKWNIENVLNRFRYGEPKSTWDWDDGSVDERDEICKGFVGEIREMDLLLPHRMKPDEKQGIIGMHPDLDDDNPPPILTSP